MSSRNRRFRALTAIAVSGALVLAACGDDDDSASPAATDAAADTDSASEAADGTPVRIGFVTTDEGSVGLPSVTAGADAAVEYINEELGGVNGHPIELVKCSVDVDPQSNQKCAQQFANADDVHLVNTGFLFNPAPFYTALNASGKALVGTTSLAEADYSADGVFWAPGQLIQRANVRLAMVAAPDLSKVGMIRQDNPTGETSEMFVKEALEEFAPDAELTAIPISQGSSDLLGAVNRLGDPDVYFLNVGGAACIQGLEAMHSVSPDTPVVPGAACANASVIDQLGAEVMEDVHFASNSEIVTIETGLSEDAQLFNEKYAEYGDAQFAEDPFAAQQWGVTVTIARFLSELSEDELFDSEAIAAALQDFEGPVALGSDELSCPGTVEEVICATYVRAYKITDGEAAPLEGNEQISIG